MHAVTVYLFLLLVGQALSYSWGHGSISEEISPAKSQQGYYDYGFNKPSAREIPHQDYGLISAPIVNANSLHDGYSPMSDTHYRHKDHEMQQQPKGRNYKFQSQ